MTKYDKDKFSVNPRPCGGCDQRDVWLRKADEEIKELKKELGAWRGAFVYGNATATHLNLVTVSSTYDGC